MISGLDKTVELVPLGTMQGNAGMRDVATVLRKRSQTGNPPTLERWKSENRQRKTLTIGVDDLASIMKLDPVQYINIPKKRRKTNSLKDNDKSFGSPAVCDMQSRNNFILLFFKN